jgi:hypothetical protein
MIKNQKINIPLISLILSNLVPIFGVIFLQWSIEEIIFLYWFENIVIGIYNIFKIIKSEGQIKYEENQKVNRPLVKTFIIVFFIFHYGFFTLIHGVFVFTLFIKSNILNTSILWAILSLFISHGISYFKNYLGSGEYKKVDPNMLFLQPYKRIVIIHLTIIFGGILVSVFGSNFLALIILISAKIFLDIKLHQKEHKKFQAIFKED